jgi:hypothetical protein
MPGWGTGSFENEGAQNWLVQLKTLSAVDLRNIFSAVDAINYISASDASVVVAAAEVVATLKGAPAQSIPREIEDWLDMNAETPSLNDTARRLLCAQARHAVNRVRASSELKDLWLEADGLNEWSAGLRELEQRLAD